MIRLLLPSVLILISCNFVDSGASLKTTSQDETLSEVDLFYQKNQGNLNKSESVGRVSNGRLINGKLFPFSGKNYHYFDTLSYLSSRAYVNDKVKKIVLDTYAYFAESFPNHKFCLMECSHEHGGKLFPHKTHQNGLSVDFMSPLLKNNKPYYDLDSIGSDHYWLDFDNKGQYLEDPSIQINFDLMAQHILALNKFAIKNEMRIKKVIFKIELKDELFASRYGQELKKSGIYIVKALSPLINNLHDDHYHIDFETL